jgi:hypothetical protein
MELFVFAVLLLLAAGTWVVYLAAVGTREKRR